LRLCWEIAVSVAHVENDFIGMESLSAAEEETEVSALNVLRPCFPLSLRARTILMA
jgi:hypothetical protein